MIVPEGFVCESCHRRPPTRLAIMGGAEFFVCAPCDLVSLERERMPMRVQVDNAHATAARRRLAATY